MFYQQMKRTCDLVLAWQQHFSIVVGRNFTDVFEEDRLPQLLSHLVQKSSSLIDKLKGFPELPATRIDSTKVRVT